MKKSKGQTIDLFYASKKETNKKTKNKTKNRATKKNAKIKNNNEIINLDNEIIIGLTPKKANEKKQKNTKSKKVNNKKIKLETNSQKSKKTTLKSNIKKQNPKKKIKMRIIKWMLIFILLVGAIALFLMSSVFNIKEIVVVNNNKVSSKEIIDLASLKTDVNMFKITNGTIKNGIKTNAYIEDVKIKRNINGTVTLDIKERQATYMLKFANAYVYINNQGYMLEISENPIELTTITGFSTTNEEMKAGNRLNKEDLQKLDDVIKIVEISKDTPLVNAITEIDISNAMDYKLKIASESKTIRIGEMTNINIKLQMAGKVFEAEKEKAGEIYFQDNGKKAIFKEEVTR